MDKSQLALHFHRVRRTTLIALFCVSVLIGLGLVQTGLWAFGWVWLVGMAAFLIISFGKKAIFAVPAVVLAGLIFGIWRGSAVQAGLHTYQNYVGQKVVITGTVIEDAAYGNKGQRDMRLKDVRINGRSPPGSVRVTAFTFAQPRRGDVVQASGKLYEGFGNYQAAMYFANLTILSTTNNPIDTLRHSFAASVYSLLPDTEASLGLGILLGIKSELPDTLDEQLKTLALTHIVVASGYNLTILVRLARRLFEKRSKFQTAAVATSLITSFVLITGFSASMGRAALVTGLSVAAWYWGRRIHPIVLLAFAAALTASIHPLYLWSDIGWWLSFLAFSGVLILAPLLQHRLWGAKQPKLVGQIVVETCAAQIMTVPLVLTIFGTFSVLGLIANVAIVPLVPLGMLFTFIAGIVGSLFGTITAYAALPALWLLDYMTQIVSLFASIPWASVDVKINMVGMIGLYALLVMFSVVLWRKTKHNFLVRSVIE